MVIITEIMALPDEICQDCGKPISRRAKANVWNGERVICTPCLKKRETAAVLAQNIAGMIGVAGKLWLVHDGRTEHGPYPTDQLIAMLTKKKISWNWKTWREGMKAWTPIARLFVDPAFSGTGRIELRDFGQGDGTYRPVGATR